MSSYEEATEASNHIVYSVYLIEAALRVNGYSEEEINNFFNNAESNFTYERNGFELKEIGDEKEFTSSDGSSTIDFTPFSIKLDVRRANIGYMMDSPFEPKDTSVEDIVEYLQSDSEFTTTEYERKVVFENDIYNDDDTITIYHTYHWEDYHNVLFSCEDDIITYEDGELEDYYDAESALSHHMFALQVVSTTLKLNGYTTEQIKTFFENEDNQLDYERHGIEIKELGDSKSFTSSDGSSTITTSPMSIKIDLARANLDKKSDNEEEISYVVLNGPEGAVSTNEELTFKFNIEYSKFLEDGKVYIDGELIDSSNYTSKEGSTIITFNSNYVKTLSAKEHTLKVAVADGEVETQFTIANGETTNPQTGDNIMLYISMLGLSLIGLATTGIYAKKKLLIINK